LEGGLFVVSGIDRAGEDLTKKYVGSIYSVQQMVGGQRPFLYQVFLEQKLADKKVTLKLGASAHRTTSTHRRSTATR
jgi:Carbohydrate-selective porin